MSTQEQREWFEAWHIDYVGRRPMLDSPAGQWEDDKRAFAAWQASEAATIERCAKVARIESLADATDCVEDKAYNDAVRHCEKAILALLSKEG